MPDHIYADSTRSYSSIPISIVRPISRQQNKSLLSSQHRLAETQRNPLSYNSKHSFFNRSIIVHHLLRGSPFLSTQSIIFCKEKRGSWSPYPIILQSNNGTKANAKCNFSNKTKNCPSRRRRRPLMQGISSIKRRLVKERKVKSKQKRKCKCKCKYS